MATGSIGTPASGGGCGVCEKAFDDKNHKTALGCKHRLGCAKCRAAKDHKASECPEPYPHWENPICDFCHESDHECKDWSAKNCAYPEVFGLGVGNHCKLCGHGDHVKKDKCPFVQGVQGGEKNIAESEVDHFTPKYRLIWRKKFAPKAAPPSPKASSSKTASTGETPSSPKSSPRGSKSLPTRAAKAAEDLAAEFAEEERRAKLTPQERAAEDKKQKAEEKKREYEREEAKIPKHPQPYSSAAPPIKSNFFEIRLGSAILYRYSITLLPISGRVPKQKDLKRSLIQEIMTNTSSKPNHDKWASDFDSLLVSSVPLFPDSDFDEKEKSITRSFDRTKHSGETETVSCVIKQLDNVNTQGLKNHVTKNGPFLPNVEAELKALNIISWKRINNPNLFSGGLNGKKFYPEELVTAEESKTDHLYFIRKGFFSSMRPGENSILLNVNPATSAFYAPIALKQWVNLKWRSKPSANQFQKVLRGVKVTVNIGKHKKKSIRSIWSIGESTIQHTMFQPKEKEGGNDANSSRKSSHRGKNNDAKEVSVLEYLQKKFREDSFNASSYSINVGNDEHKTWYPIDKLTIINWQVVKKLMDDEPYKTEMLAAAQYPQGAKNTIRACAMKYLGLAPLQLKTSDSRPSSAPEFYKDFDITTFPKLVELNPKKLTPPTLKFSSAEVRVNAGSWNLGGRTFFKNASAAGASGSLSVLHIISFDGAVSPNIRDKLRSSLFEYGISSGNDIPVVLTAETQPGNEGSVAYRTSCQAALNRAIKSWPVSSPIRCVLVILSKKSIPFYSEIKMWGDCIMGIPTVCITRKKLNASATDDGLRANLCLKFNLKLKGVSHEIQHSCKDAQALKKWKTENRGMTHAPLNTMILGADVTHPGKSAEHCPSIAAVVATTDDISTHYLGSARLQPPKQEFISDLRSMIKERAIAWFNRALDRKAKAGALFPQTILFYRDGVSESQYGMVRYEELPQIKYGLQDAFDKLKKMGGVNGFCSTKITLIVVTKRHHVRFYPKDDLPNPYDANNEKKDYNVPCSTVADTTVVTPNHFSFYLQSHASPLGTAKNGHYVVIHDENNFGLKDLEEITNNICYTGSRATKALSICTPARYADFLCDRLRCYMKPVLDGLYIPRHKEGSEPLEDGNPGHESYANDRFIWPTVAGDGKRDNPWGSDVGEIQFYL